MVNSKETATFIQSSSFQEFSPKMEQWVLYKEKLDIHFSQLNCEDDNQKRAILLKSIGPEPYELLHNLCSPLSPVVKSYKELCDLLKKHYTPPVILYKARKNFHKSEINEYESVVEWYARVKELSMNCKFGNALEEFVLNQFINGLPQYIFEKICEEDETLTLERALNKSLIIETKAHENNNKEINLLNSKLNCKNNNNKRNMYNGQKKYNNNKSGSQHNNSNKCSHCGWRNHNSNECRYKNCKCNHCNKTGHLESICRNKNKKINFLNNSNYEQNYNDEFFFYSVHSSFNNNAETVLVEINGAAINMICDTGSPNTFISEKLFKQINFKLKLNSCKSTYFGYSGKKIITVGEFNTSVLHKGVCKELKLIVTKGDSTPLAGRDFLKTFNYTLKQINSVQSKDQFKRNYAEVFDGSLGKYKFAKISLAIKTDAKPIFFKPRSIPLAWKSKVENE